MKCDDVRQYNNSFIMYVMMSSHMYLSPAKSGNLLMEFLIPEPYLLLLITVLWFHKLLKAGFTTIRDCGSTNTLYLKDAVKNGELWSEHNSIRKASEPQIHICQ